MSELTKISMRGALFPLTDSVRFSRARRSPHDDAIIRLEALENLQLLFVLLQREEEITGFRELLLRASRKHFFRRDVFP